MGEGESARGGAPRPVIYCILPLELAGRLHEPLRRHFRDEPHVRVVVESRLRQRRHVPERRSSEAAEAPSTGERRRIRNATGRRVDERRALAVPARVPDLPRRARAYADQLTFIERLEPEGEQAEDIDTARLVTEIQAGYDERFAELYLRYFDRVYAYLAIALDDAHEAEDATQQIFIKVLQALPRYERRRQPFRAWLFTIVRNHAVSDIRRRRGVVPTDPGQLDRRREQDEPDEADLRALDWISDSELLLFVERLPHAQRQVLMLRYMLDLSATETAAILGRSATDVRTLQYRALQFLKARLTAIGREPRHGGRQAGNNGWVRRHKQARILRNRRFALM